MSEVFLRQSGIINENDIPLLHIVGAGGIGSWTAFLCAKMGARDIIVYDSDTVEEHNTGSQFFKPDDIGLPKTEALKKNILMMTGTAIETREAKKENDIERGIVILALDTMGRRIALAKRYSTKPIYIIDGRMGGLQAELYAQEASEYLAVTCDNDKADLDPCTARAISFNCAVIAGFIANAVRLFCKNGASNRQAVVFGFNSYQLIKKK